MREIDGSKYDVKAGKIGEYARQPTIPAKVDYREGQTLHDSVYNDQTLDFGDSEFDRATDYNTVGGAD